MYVQGRMKTSTHLLVGYAFDEACDREALNRTRQSRVQIGKIGIAIGQTVVTALVQALTRNPNEPRIRKIVDRVGNISWKVYDPQCFRSLMFDSEAEVMQWLEQRYA